ncbi:hypothetical protein LCGC14_0175380 [marine sediment metagenome]|uniref:Uncharacterized protein n=1 Tax=marine sediment metagenome TaxID=412755 RepID=A0A0F9UVA1_9ZZZZ
MKYDILLKNRKNGETIKAIALSVSIETIPDYIIRHSAVMINLDYYIEIRPGILHRVIPPSKT